MKTQPLYLLLITVICSGHLSSNAQNNSSDISVRIKPIGNKVYMLDCVGGFGGGNVAASIGEDGILLVDDMYDMMVPKLLGSLKSVSDKPVIMVVNTHFHRDHIEGNKTLSQSSTIIGHANTQKRLFGAKQPQTYPFVSFTERLKIRFNGENISIIHLPNCHTDGDAIVFFEDSKVLHLGDMFFFGMFPAVYTEGGGNIKQLITSLESVLNDFPAETKVIPGHGELATMDDLHYYVTMLKETVDVVEKGIALNKSVSEMESDSRMSKYLKLGEGGAQTSAQYVAMLQKLLK